MANVTGTLPKMRNEDTIRKSELVNFGGYNHTEGAKDGDIWHMENITGELSPVLSCRNQRWQVAQLEKPNGFYCRDNLFWVDGTRLYKDGVDTGLELEDSRKQFVTLGAYVCIWPDKKYYNTLDGTFGSLEAQATTTAYFMNANSGYLYEDAKMSCIYMGYYNANMFRDGDAVTISGCTKHPENNTTIIVRKVHGDGVLEFYENSFVGDQNSEGEKNVPYWEDGPIRIKREVPDLDFIIENENRLWGCKGDTIYASKLGDPFNWNVFDGVGTDSYAVNVGSAGDFTAAYSYLGYPVFFKEEYIYKVYGSKPSNFQVMSSASLGVEEGSHLSLGIAGEILFYLSRIGVVAYSGGIPQNMAQNFGTQRFRNGVAGSDGRRYYISMEDIDGQWHLFVYDADVKQWVREDDTCVMNWGWNHELYFMDDTGGIWLTGNIRDIPDGAEPEGTIESCVEFADFVESSPNKKGTNRFQLRVGLEEGSELDIDVMFDSDGEWHRVRSLAADRKRSFQLPIIPRRSDHFRLKLTGRGPWKCYSLVRENYIGSEYR